MQHLPESIDDIHVELVNDDQTPYDFVISVIQSVFGKSNDEAKELANTVHRTGSARLGPYAPAIAQSMIELIGRKSQIAGHPFAARVSNAAIAANTVACSFCGKMQADCKFIYQGRASYICDGCVINCARALNTATPSSVMRNIFELLDWHFGGVPEADVVSVERTFPLRMRADLQRALDDVLKRDGVRVVGIHGGNSYDGISFANLFGERRYPKTIGPLQFEEVDIGDDAPMRCLVNALWLLRDGELPMAVLLARKPHHEAPGLVVTVATPAGILGKEFADSLFRRLENAVTEAQSYRGKVLSLDTQDHYRGFATGVTVHHLPPIAREAVVLPDETIRLIDRNVVQFAQLRSKLIALGQSGKKGLLFHGAPGTGKTHTVRYLAGRLPDHTTLLVTAGQAGAIADYFALARLLQPAILVIEDADLIARNREEMGSPCEEVLLNQLLNEMDGLKPDAAIFVILTTNRPKMLEAALAQRPGRVDQAVEFPLPDLSNRLKLIDLYKGSLQLEQRLAESVAGRIDGVSAAFIKELMRRLAQTVIERGETNKVEIADVDTALGELALGNDRLTQTLLGVE